MSHVTRTPLSRSKVNLQGVGAYCGGLPHSLFIGQVETVKYINREMSPDYMPVHHSRITGVYNAVYVHTITSTLWQATAGQWLK